MTVHRIPRMLTLTEIAIATRAGGAKGISVKTLRREIAAGKLRATRIRGCLRILDVDLTAFLRANGGTRSERETTGGYVARE